MKLFEAKLLVFHLPLSDHFDHISYLHYFIAGSKLTCSTNPLYRILSSTHRRSSSDSTYWTRLTLLNGCMVQILVLPYFWVMRWTQLALSPVSSAHGYSVIVVIITSSWRMLYTGFVCLTVYPLAK